MIKEAGCERIMNDWRKLQTSDHFYYMCTKFFTDGDVHKYFSPYDSPYDSYINFMNVLNSLIERCSRPQPKIKIDTANSVANSLADSAVAV
jgi:alpha-amylase